MINDNIILHSHLIYLKKKTCYIVDSLKKKSKPLFPFSSKPSIQTHPKFVAEDTLIILYL